MWRSACTLSVPAHMHMYMCMCQARSGVNGVPELPLSRQAGGARQASGSAEKGFCEPDHILVQRKHKARALQLTIRGAKASGVASSFTRFLSDLSAPGSLDQT